MNKLLSLAGGLLGGYGLLKTPLENSFLSGLDPVVDVVGIVAMLVFSVGLIYTGVRDWIQR
ncbi:hypothetical protein [Brevibacillus panacihumi]|uniref:DUF1232 domain-containing protein n=1 Tax=Brevibacillus panacihumi TaxID=497735 RepID=A0A3M8DDA9_9BACL|nr:hypothetical protein [Brevibacillus panacihumi]RNB85561.1 hypothetical protein EDM58_03265 [Brevibacillus panacihumi]